MDQKIVQNFVFFLIGLFFPSPVLKVAATRREDILLEDIKLPP